VSGFASCPVGERLPHALVVPPQRAGCVPEQRKPSHVYVFDHGRIVEDGRYDDLLVAGGRFAEIFAEQA
jgi:hypothetical protein